MNRQNEEDPSLFPRAGLVRTLSLIATARSMAKMASQLRQLLAAPPEVTSPDSYYRVSLSAEHADTIVDFLSACEAETSKVDAAEADRLTGLVDRWVRYYLFLTRR